MNKIFYYKIKKNIEKNILNSQILSLEEKKRANAFKFEKDFNLYVAGKLLVKNKIASLLDLQPREIIFKTDQYDRPFLDNPKVKDFDFNLSHSGEYVVLAISDSRVGVDIERIKPIDLDLSKDCFHDKERDFLLQNKNNQLDVFYTIWTLKESFIKAIGEGLSYPLKSFYFDIEKNKININILDNNYQEKWIFKTYNIDNDYKLSVCCKYKESLNELIKENSLLNYSE